jgi:hypothetical protein
MAFMWWTISLAIYGYANLWTAIEACGIHTIVKLALFTEDEFLAVGA